MCIRDRDKAEAIVREISTITGLDAQDIPRLLSTVIRRLNAQKRIKPVLELVTADIKEQEQELEILDISESEKAVLRVLLDLQLNPASIDANIFPMLSLAEDLKIAIRSGLKGVHAMALQKLSAKNLGLSEQKAQSIREKTTQKVIVEKLSAIATRKLVTEVLASQSQSSVINDTSSQDVTQTSRRLQKLSLELLKKTNPSELLQFQEVLRQKLIEIEQVLKQN